MNRCTFVLSVALLALCACDIAAPQPGEGLANGEIVRVTMGFSNTSAFIIRFNEGQFALIDTGEASEEENPLLDKLSAMGGRPEQVEHIFFTHGHGDHIGNANLFPNASLHSLEAEVPFIEGREVHERPLPGGDPEDTGLRVDAPIVDGQTFQLGNKILRVIALPGHTPGSAVYLVDGILFLGDAVTATNEGELTGATWIFSTDVEENDRSLRTLVEHIDDAGLEVSTLAPAHTSTLAGGMGPLRRYVASLSGE